ncbi:MAG: type II secretion system protein [Acidobacteria bacterium]|nr:type II secretion system protein [Acidobacteriota bacterium]MCB9398919.1 type II secretion system protein [Acidobacteriota bacterium]
MKRAFTLLEMLFAMVLVGLIGLIIGGTLSMSVRAWESTQRHVSQNYNRRTVLDMVKRQTSSIFYRSEAEEYARQADSNNLNNIDNRPGANNLTPNQRLEEMRRRTAERRGQRTSRDDRAQQESNSDLGGGAVGFELPQGAAYFKGEPQSIQFLSTVSFLSDFPGQVAVKYYVVKGEEDENGEIQFSDLEVGESDDPEVLPEGSLYLVLEEMNLFLTSTLGQDELPETAADLHLDRPGDRPDPETTEDEEPEPIEGSTVVSTNQMVLLGPLRSFEIRYRKPAQRGAEETDEEDDWAESWDLETEGRYPSAVEFTLFYEEGADEDVPTEELPGIRMVIPVYDTQNLQRLRDNGPF